MLHFHIIIDSTLLLLKNRNNMILSFLGHTQSWGKGISKLLTPCYSNGSLNRNFGPVDPSRQENYKFVATLLKEVKAVFPDSYIHLGGDEVDYSCW